MKKRGFVSTLVIAAIIVGIGLSLYYTRPVTIEVDEIQKNVTISEQFREVNLRVTGVSNVVSVDKNTNIINVTMLGIKNTLILCYGIHNPQEINNNGLYDFVKFIKC